jgi:alanine racemase
MNQAMQPVGDASLAGGVLTIDLGAIRRNYRRLRDLAAPSRTAAVVKANAYGCGIEPVVEALAEEGCRVFFTALVEEAQRVRAVRDDQETNIYVLNGFPPGTAAEFARGRLRPVLGSREEVAEWAAFCRTRGERRRAGLHFDTGINRLGLRHDEAQDIAESDEVGAFVPDLLLSHFACADEPEHPLNREQIARFDAVSQCFPRLPRSFANSAAVQSGIARNYDLARPGIALYGGRALNEGDNPMEPVVRVEVRVIQLRHVAPGETVGYGAAWTARRPTRLALVSAGYADGYQRALGSADGRPGAKAAVVGRRVPVIGRVSMDLVALDVTDLPDDMVGRGTHIELIGPTVGVDELASHAGTIGYEILTSLGRRYARRVVDSEKDQAQSL